MEAMQARRHKRDRSQPLRECDAHQNEKRFVVRFSYAVVEPYAVVVKSLAAPITLPAVLAAFLDMRCTKVTIKLKPILIEVLVDNFAVTLHTHRLV